MAADSELSVKNGAELLDRLIKDIVAEQSTTYVSILVHPSMSHDDSMGLPRTTAFSLPRFIPLLSERIRAKNPFTRNFLVSWITVLDSIPDLELVSFLPAFLDGLLQFLSDPHDVRYATSNVLANFLAEIREAVEVKEQQKQQAMKNYFVEQQRKLVATSETAVDAGESVKDDDGDDSTLVKSSINSIDGDINWDAVSISETEGRGKGSWVPGQGVVINYTRIVEILMPHLSSPGTFFFMLNWLPLKVFFFLILSVYILNSFIRGRDPGNSIKMDKRIYNARQRCHNFLYTTVDKRRLAFIGPFSGTYPFLLHFRL